MTTNHENAQKGNYTGEGPGISYTPNRWFSSLHSINCAFKSFVRDFTGISRISDVIPTVGMIHAASKTLAECLVSYDLAGNHFKRTFCISRHARQVQYNSLNTISLTINVLREGLFNIIIIIRSYRRARGGGESDGAIHSYSNGGIRHVLSLTPGSGGSLHQGVANARGFDLRVVSYV